MTSNRSRSSNLTKWSGKTAGGLRKVSASATPILGNTWCKDAQSHALRYTTSDVDQQSYSEHEVKFVDTKSSEETIVELDADGNAITPRDIRKHKSGAISRRNQQDNEEYTDLMQTTLTLEKLNLLRELQKKRDLSERYYSQEIKRLLGNNYLGPKTPMPILKNNEKSINWNLQPYAGDRQKDVLKSLEPCGTMTTVTRLDCGCVQQTTRPIFTTLRGRVHKKSCYQNQKTLKSPPPGRREHFFSVDPPETADYYTTQKKQIALDSKSYPKIPVDVNNNVEMEHNKKMANKKSAIPGRMSRHGSPLRKQSDTSTTSI